MISVAWEAQGVIDDNIKKETLVSTLQDRMLTWYIKYPNDNPNAGVADIQIAKNLANRSQRRSWSLGSRRSQ